MDPRDTINKSLTKNILRKKSFTKREKIPPEMVSNYIRRVTNMGVNPVKAQVAVGHAARVWNTGMSITGSDTFMDVVMTVLKTKRYQNI